LKTEQLKYDEGFFGPGKASNERSQGRKRQVRHRHAKCGSIRENEEDRTGAEFFVPGKASNERGEGAYSGT
jgi:hypothetical protein